MDDNPNYDIGHFKKPSRSAKVLMFALKSWANRIAHSTTLRRGTFCGVRGQLREVFLF